MAKGVSLRAFARAMGVTLKAVQNARDSKRITLNPDGTIDPVRARAEWNDRTLHSKRHRGGPKDEAGGTGKGPEGQAGPSATAGWNAARTVRETLQARLLELDLKQRMGVLVPAEQVRAHAFRRARETRDKLLALPGQLGPVLAGITDPGECVRLLETELGRVCDELAESAPALEREEGAA